MRNTKAFRPKTLVKHKEKGKKQKAKVKSKVPEGEGNGLPEGLKDLKDFKVLKAFGETAYH